jgi:Family of unknown function (DUF6165)
MPPLRPIEVEISPGELFDKITILQIKHERITESERRRNVRLELEALIAARNRCAPEPPGLSELVAGLRGLNERLWELEDAVRACERDQEFGERFISLARSIYQSNDRRAAQKRRIDELFDARLKEEKSYITYD